MATYTKISNLPAITTVTDTDKVIIYDTAESNINNQIKTALISDLNKNVIAYVNNVVTGVLNFRGYYDASVNSYPSSGGSGTSGAIKKGDTFIISVQGTLGSNVIQIGDWITSLIDTPGSTDANWGKFNTNYPYVPEDSYNKVTSISGSSTDTQYPSAKLIYNQLALKLAKTSDTITTVKELINIVAGKANDTLNIDYDTSAIWYFTVANSANYVRNFRGSSTVSLNTRMAIGESISLAIMVTQGSTAYLPSSYTIDGNAITPKWANGSAPSSGKINSLDVVYVTIIKTANATFTMLKSLTGFS